MSIFGFQSMSQSRRKAKRHEISGDQRIDVQIFRNGCGSDCTDNNEIVAAEIVDISLTGVKVESATAFEFEEKKLPVKRSNSWVDALADFGDMDDLADLDKIEDKMRTTF